MKTKKLLGIYTDWGRLNSNMKYGAIAWYRIINPLKKLGANIIGYFKLEKTVENAMELKSKGDIWVIKITDTEGIDFYWNAHKTITGAKLVLDLDDDPISINRDHPEYKKLQEKQNMRERMIKVADHIIVSTEPIKQTVKHLNPHVTVIPNAIDPEIWNIEKPPKRKDGKIRIGWIASGSHIAEFPLILPALREIKEKYPNVEVHMAGITLEELNEDRVFHHVGTRGYAEFPEWYADLDLDIAIAPLIDTPFNRAKSNIKWMEAAMLELPCVCSPAVYEESVEHGKTGYIAKNTSQFVKYLSWLIENPEKRKEIGKNAKAEVLKNWTIDKFLPLYDELFDKLMEKKDISVLTAITGNKDDLLKQPEYKGVQYVAFMDKNPHDEQWEYRKACNKFVKPVMNAKIHKILSHKYVDTPYIVWMDGNMKLKQDPHELVKLMGDKDLAFFTHPGRDCVYEEAETCISLKKGELQEIGEQIKDYAKQQYPQHSGLCELTAFIRKNNPETNELFEKWWAEITRYSERDQLSFPIVFQNQDWAVIPGTVAEIKEDPIFKGNDYFKWKQHKTL